ncbi:L,D-transpeptidase family protein [Brevibacillus sp. AG]|uniref:L,D-transpeptidase family protein n=1 Tax=Brevibacillus sp. AG TaxID=3020891 RepID=UPI0008536EB9|nr:L,D-transpeptidase [Brevibacillus sp. AG]MDC0761980.1 L,D-transpeptidase family protein [Brevibacillus sp. AG]
MDKVSFLQEKSTFHMKYPDQSDLAFYRWYTTQYPTEAIGWFHLGQEREAQGNTEQALEAYRRGLVSKQGSYYTETRDAYQRLLRDRQRNTLGHRTRLLLASLLFLYFQFAFSPGPLRDASTKTTPQAAKQPVPTTAQTQPHVEIIAVPPTLSARELSEQVRRYVESRRPALTQPFTVMVVPEVPGSPLFRPLLFYQPREVRGILRYNPTSRTVLSEKWWEKPVQLEREPTLATGKTELTDEQLTLQHVLILRNALYRYYQQTGTLPAQLSDLAGAYPGNYLPQIPVPPKRLLLKSYPYHPKAFLPESAWDSLRNVLPLPGYPEPVAPFEPLQLHLTTSTHTMKLISGSHLVRSYPVAIGKNGSTPEGYYTIQQKINQPRGHDNIYGTRGMVFQENGYAIHGTNHPESIGSSVSLGCVRLYNAAVEELYSFVSLGTEFIISNAPSSAQPWSNPVPFVLPAGPEEETPQVIYNWLH